MIRMYTIDESGYNSDHDYDMLSQRAMFFMNVLEDNDCIVISNSYHGYPTGGGHTVQRFVITYRSNNDEKFNFNRIENETNRLFNLWKKGKLK